MPLKACAYRNKGDDMLLPRGIECFQFVRVACVELRQELLRNVILLVFVMVFPLGAKQGARYGMRLGIKRVSHAI